MKSLNNLRTLARSSTESPCFRWVVMWSDSSELLSIRPIWLRRLCCCAVQNDFFREANASVQPGTEDGAKDMFQLRRSTTPWSSDKREQRCFHPALFFHRREGTCFAMAKRHSVIFPCFWAEIVLATIFSQGYDAFPKHAENQQVRRAPERFDDIRIWTE